MVTIRTMVPASRLHAPVLQGRELAALIVTVQVLVLTLLSLAWPGHAASQAAVSVVAFSMLLARGEFAVQIELSALDRLPRVSTAFAGATGAIAAGLVIASQDESALDALRFGPLAFASSWAALVGSYWMGIYSRRRGIFSDRAVVLGSGRVADRINSALLERPEYGLDVVGHVAPVIDTVPGETPRLGVPEALLATCQAHRATVVVVAYSQAPESELLEPLRDCAASHIRVLVVPRFYEDLSRHQVPHGVWGVPLQRLPMPTAGRVRRLIKRTIDVTVAGAAFVLLLPVMVVCGFAITRETGAGMLFRQTRVGQDERPIEVLKFQTMRPADSAESDTLWNISNDARLGPVGRFMRRSSLDELPQLWNIIRGDMSLVGPRPERPHFVEQFKEEIPSYGARHRVPVGLTGWAQVHELRGDSSIEERARFDNAYAASWSPWEDVKIMLRTVREVVRGSGG